MVGVLFFWFGRGGGEVSRTQLAFSLLLFQVDFLCSPQLSCRTINIVFTRMLGRLTFLFFSLLA